jgi:predicted transcriptional regulator YdeE
MDAGDAGIETVALPELVLIGCEIAGPRDLRRSAIPEAWRRLLLAGSGATSFLAVSLPHEKGRFHEIVGFLAARETDVPAGLRRHVLAAGHYLRLSHEAPLGEIPLSFARLEAHARAKGLETTDLRLDTGYRAGLPEGPHELYLALAAPTLKLAGG